jgi:hypothetical protein
MSRVATTTISVVSAEPTPVILSFGLTNNMVAITWSSVTNLIYRMQRADSLSGTNWINVSPDVTATGPITTETNVIGNAPQKFYRIILLTP